MIATGSGILCPACGSPESGVVDSRPGANYIRRRRKCRACGERVTTMEISAPGIVAGDPESVLRSIRFYAALETLPVREQDVIRSMLLVLMAKKQDGAVEGDASRE